VVDGVDRAQLAEFLRARREALRPDDVGLGPGARRRTPGLRREEVAALANMSVDYYVRLEQQRTPPPSEQMVASIARALRLSPDERDHLFRLSGHNVPERHAASDQIGPGLARVLDRLADTPAMVATDLGEALTQNELAVALLGDQRGFTGPARSMLYRWFTDAAARHRYPPEDHDHESRALVADLRAALARRRHDARAAALVDELIAGSAEFAGLWRQHEVAVRRSDHKRIVHPEVGLIELECQALVAESQAQVLLVFTASPGTDSAERLHRLAAAQARSRPADRAGLGHRPEPGGPVAGLSRPEPGGPVAGLSRPEPGGPVAGLSRPEPGGPVAGPVAGLPRQRRSGDSRCLDSAGRLPEAGQVPVRTAFPTEGHGQP
jgi:transcriptional regulator with XRE-family HTH domain